jgi:hypothetical protein
MSFQHVQYQFAAHLRDPERNAPPPELEERRLKIYRELFYNNIEDFIAKAFPVLRRISSDVVWHARVRDFYARHRCHEPQFYRIAEEFLRFLDSERGAHADDPPFIRELCHYERVELDLAVAEEELTPGLADPNGDLLDGRPFISPLAVTLAYDYPVHRIGPDFQPTEPGPQPTYLIVNRDRGDAIKFMEINAVTARLIDLLESDSYSTGRQLLTQIAIELQHPKPHEVVAAGGAVLKDLRRRDIVLGTRRVDPA